MSVPLVIYHKGCHDGWCSAWIFDRCYRGVQLHPAAYGDEPPKVDKRNVIIVDFSYPRETLIEMHQHANSLLVLDHHASAQKNCVGLEFAVFDMERSGATMAYDYCKQHNLLLAVEDRTVESGMKMLAKYVEDRDLFRHQLANSRSINASIRSHRWELPVWDNLAKKVAMNIGQLIVEGEAIERQRELMIEHHINKADEMIVAGFKVPVVQLTVPDILSDVVGRLAEGQPFAMSYVVGGDGWIYCGLRSDHNGQDVSEIATSFGGGGHKHAAGFKIPGWMIEGIDPVRGVKLALSDGCDLYKDQ